MTLFLGPGSYIFLFRCPPKAFALSGIGTMGRRGTGSHSVVLENAFVPEQAITLQRPCGEYRSVWNVILTVAPPLICSAYVGVAEAAAEKALASAKLKGNDGVNVLVIGEMQTELTAAQIALERLRMSTS